MAKKDKKQEKERPEDLTQPVDEEIERRVDEMLDPTLPDDTEPSKTDEPVTPSAPAIGGLKKITVFHDQGSDAAPTAPEIKGKAEQEIPVKDDAGTKAVEQGPAESDELHQAIEEANAQLAAQTAPLLTKGPVVPGPEKAELTTDKTVTAAAPPPEAAKPPEISQAPAAIEAQKPPVDAGALPDAYADEETARAVNDIIATESDELLAARDEKQAAVLEPKRPSGTFMGTLLRDFWRSRLLRWLIVLIILGVGGTAAAMPVTRYYALNAAGVRVGASLQVIDQSTQQPLKGVKVDLGGQSALTDSDGKASFSKLRLGETGLSIQKRAFTPINEQVTLGWGSNPLGSRNLTPAGSQYSFTVTDYLSGKPIAKVAATAGDADAQSDEKGQIKLTLEHSSDPTVTVTISAPDYREEKITLDLNSKQTQALKLVPSRKEVFVSRRSGTYDVYKVDLDGKNEELVLKGTGSERDDLVLLPSPTDEVAALVSTRENKHNTDGYLLSTLTLINLRDNSTKTVTQSEQIKPIGWLDGRLVYVQVASGASAADPNRQRLMSYDYKSLDNRQLAASNYFNDMMVAAGQLYYAPSSSYQPNGAGAAVFRVNADATHKQTLLPLETWNIFRPSYDHIVFSLPGNNWYEYKLGSSAPTKLDQPGSQTSRLYIDSPDGKRSLWVDNRDGKGVLLLYDVAAKNDNTLRTQSGLTMPVRWLNDHVVIYRIHTDQETADYALSLDGGSPVKIKDVTNTGGVDKWYYY